MKKKSADRKVFFSNITMKFGEMAVWLGVISDTDIKDALVVQESGQDDRRIGMVLVDSNKITTKEVNEILNRQAEFEKFMIAKEEEEADKTTTRKLAKKRPKAATKKSGKKKPAKAAAKKKTSKAVTKTSVKKKPAKAAARKKTAAKKPAK